MHSDLFLLEITILYYCLYFCFDFSIYRDLKWKAGIIKENPESLISHPVFVFRLVSQLYEFFVEAFHMGFRKSYAEGMFIYIFFRVKINVVGKMSNY